MKKLLTILFLLPFFAFGQTSATLQWKTYPTNDSIAYTGVGLPLKTILTGKWVRDHYVKYTDTLNKVATKYWVSSRLNDNVIRDTMLWSSTKAAATDLSNRGTQATSFNDVLLKAEGKVDYLPFIREEASDHWEVYLPYNKLGEYQTWRFSTAGIAETYSPSGFTKPYQMDLINDNFLSTQSDYTVAANATLVGTWTVSGAIRYSTTAGDKMTFTVPSGYSIRFTYVSDNNMGIAYLKLDGKNPPGYPIDASGNAYVDMYAASTTNSSIFFNGLNDNVSHTLVITVSGLKNASSSGFRVNAQNTAAAIRIFTGYGTKTAIDYTYSTQFTPTVNFNIKPAGSAVTYAIGYRPLDQPSYRTDFIGAVHGYEQLDSLKFYFDGVETTFNQSPYSHLKSFKSLVIKQKTRLSHSQDLTRFFANVTTYHTFDTTGYHQTYRIDWINDVYIANGYSQMWTASGGNQGGDQNQPNGWSNRATLKGFQTVNIQGATPTDGTGVPHALTNEMVFWGTDRVAATQPLRLTQSGDLAEVVTITDLPSSTNKYKNTLSITDGLWVNSRDNLKKMYLQPFRNKGNTLTGEGWNGDMRVKVYYYPHINRFIDPSGIVDINNPSVVIDSLKKISTGILKATLGSQYFSRALPNYDYLPAAGESSVLAPSAGQIPIATPLSVYKPRSISGDITLDSLGVSTIGANKVTYAKMQAMTTNKLLGSGSGTAVAEITLGTGLSFTGTTLNASGSSGTVTSITPGWGHTSSTPITTSGTITVDSTLVQTVANFFPKGDTRYVTKGTAQTITGIKTFPLMIQIADASASGFVNQIGNVTTLTNNHIINFPDQAGTVAMTSDIHNDVYTADASTTSVSKSYLNSTYPAYKMGDVVYLATPGLKYIKMDNSSSGNWDEQSYNQTP